MKQIGKGLKTIGQLGFSAFICLTACFWFFESAFLLGAELKHEKSEPCTITAAGDAADADLSGANGVESYTPVIVLNTTVFVDDNRCSLTLYGINDGFIAKFTAGTMPSIYLNEYALQSFCNEKGAKVLSSSVNIASNDVSVCDVPCKITDVIDDGKQSPCGYVSINAAKTLVLASGEIPAYSELWVKLESAGFEEDVTDALTGCGLSVQSDIAKWSRWDDIQQKIKLYIVCAAVLLFASISLISANTKLDRITNRDGSDHFLIHVSRITAFVILSLVAVVLIHAIFDH